MELSETPAPAFDGARDGLKTSEPPSLSSSSLQPQQRKEPLHKVLSMGHGIGEDSYTKASEGYAAKTKTEMEVLIQALGKVTQPSRGPVVIADLGCSSGTNSIDNIALIIEKFRLRLPKDAEFQACFNDLPSNDFNSLFQLWTSDSRANNIFASGVPGSYFGRLFPRSSVHVFHSAFALHWLSKIPDEVLDKDSPAYNKGQTWIMHSSSAVVEACQKQAMADLKSFLQARAAELVPGGVLVCYFLGSSMDPNDRFNQTWAQYIGQDTNEIWTDLIAEGLLTEEQRDGFNFPVYLRNFEELREAVASCGSLFDVLRTDHREIQSLTADHLPIEFDSEGERLRNSDLTGLAKRVKGMYKSVFGVLLEAHVGKNAAEVIAERFEVLLERKMRENPDLCDLSETMCVVSLIRK